MLCGLGVALFIAVAFLITFVVLVVLKLEGASYSTAITFIPIFIIFGLIFCCCCCCVPCICCCMPKVRIPNRCLCVFMIFLIVFDV